jgi:hypothetical protein
VVAAMDCVEGRDTGAEAGAVQVLNYARTLLPGQACLGSLIALRRQAVLLRW